ncbi:MAG: class I SAM-dependent methyltransferase [Deltaproteobacteria bacterium]|nr:class I SAM-dependent methyltransferase [Deltaproteobacteria bacterium]
MKYKYNITKFDIDRLDYNNIYRIQMEMIPKNTNVLDIGCATGYMSEYISNTLGCQVTGVEVQPDHGEIAKEKCSSFVLGAIDKEDTQREVDRLVGDHGKFDVILMSQVIEHIAYPEEVLVRLRDWLKSGGFLIISTCNIANWKCRLKLLLGKWEYVEYGFLDRTHLRFFTTHTFRKLLEACGYSILDEGYSVSDFLSFIYLLSNRFPSFLVHGPFIYRFLRQSRIYKRYVRTFKNLIATEFVYKAILSPDSHRY